MAFAAPAELQASCHLLTVLQALLEAAAPQEGCLLLLGRRQGASWQLQRLWPCLNIWPDPAARRRRFLLDPREQLLAQRWARARDLEVLGAAHSHPASAPEPSASDRQLTAAPALMVIAAPSEQCRAWWLEEQGTRPRQVPWRMVD